LKIQKQINVVEEAIGEKLLDCHQLGDSLKKMVPACPSKLDRRKRILVYCPHNNLTINLLYDTMKACGKPLMFYQ
jgi:hypothetical protein